MAKVVEQCRVSPPAGSVPETCLPLTFLDVPWLLIHPTKRVYLYPLSQSQSQSHDQYSLLIPSLKHSLSLALRHFFPFAGNLVTPPPPEMPRIRFSDGDSVSFTVAESAGDFDSLFADRPRDVNELHSLVPDFPPSRVDGGTRFSPLMALQVTIFPGKGISIGVRFRHVAADARSWHHFMRYWARICKFHHDDVPAPIPVPSHDRSAIKDPNGLGLKLVKDRWALFSSQRENQGPTNDSLRGLSRITLVLTRAQIETLKRWIVQRVEDECLVVSSFVAVCALMWVCLIKSSENDDKERSDEFCPFLFVADGRGRLEFPVPTTYFGNCLSMCFVELKLSELLGEDAVVMAAKATAKGISDLEKSGGYLRGAENWISIWKRFAESGQRIVSVAGSPKLASYDTDFGFGRPIRNEALQTDGSDGFVLTENRDDEVGGLEVGFSMATKKMITFNALLEHNLKVMSD